MITFRPVVALACLGTLALANHASAQTLSLVTAWNFNNNAVGVNTSPVPSTGSGTASTLGFNSNYNAAATPTPANANSVDTSDVNAATGSSDTASPSNVWRIRGGDGTTAGNTSTGNNGWSSFAPIGSQGAQFLASTVGFRNIQVSFDWNTTTQGEAKLQLQYTLDGVTYVNVPASLFTATGGTMALTNTTSANTVNGGYLQATTTTNTFSNQITANLSGIAGANNDAKFGIRLVSAATGADDTNTAGAALNNTSGNWRFDEVTISGNAVPEPGTSVLAGTGLLGIVMLLRRHRSVA